MLDVRILTTHQCLFEGRAMQVTLPGEAGVFEVYRFHRPLVSRLLSGVVLVDELAIPIARGVVKVERNGVTAIVDPDGDPQQR